MGGEIQEFLNQVHLHRFRIVQSHYLLCNNIFPQGKQQENQTIATTVQELRVKLATMKITLECKHSCFNILKINTFLQHL